MGFNDEKRLRVSGQGYGKNSLESLNSLKMDALMVLSFGLPFFLENLVPKLEYFFTNSEQYSR